MPKPTENRLDIVDRLQYRLDHEGYHGDHLYDDLRDAMQEIRRLRANCEAYRRGAEISARRSET